MTKTQKIAITIATAATVVAVGLAIPGTAQATTGTGHHAPSHTTSAPSVTAPSTGGGLGHFYTGGPKNPPIPAPGRYPVKLPTWFTSLVHHIFNN